MLSRKEKQSDNNSNPILPDKKIKKLLEFLRKIGNKFRTASKRLIIDKQKKTYLD